MNLRSIFPQKLEEHVQEGSIFEAGDKVLVFAIV